MPNAEKSFTAATILPAKLLRNDRLIERIVRTKVIPPYHVQYIPTNRCNLNCSFCSCRDEDRQAEMGLSRALRMVDEFEFLGTRAVTITGGGEPLLYSSLSAIIDRFAAAEIEIGLVTNGTLLHTLSKKAIFELTWCRISHSDDRPFTEEYKAKLAKVFEGNPQVDWAFSYVVSGRPEYKNIAAVVRFANKYNLTHVRLVADIFNPFSVPMSSVKRTLQSQGIDDSRVIYQGRNIYFDGGPCYICYLKPVVSAEGKIYACCGAQYAIENGKRKMAEELCLGTIEQLPEIYLNPSTPLDGSICSKCYYTSYNKVLGALVEGDIVHGYFV